MDTIDTRNPLREAARAAWAQVNSLVMTSLHTPEGRRSARVSLRDLQAEIDVMQQTADDLREHIHELEEGDL